MFELPPAGEPLSQGDVIDDCPLFGLGLTETNPAAEARRWQARVIVLTQACDLAQAKAAKVVVAPVLAADVLVANKVLKAATVRDQVRRGLVYGWYFLPAITQPVSLPESIVNLQELHSVPRGVLDRLVKDGKRVARLVTPYREHLGQHFAVTYSRIGLPGPYETQP